MSDQQKPAQKSEDKELADLLDSALEDFGDNAAPKGDKASEESKTSQLIEGEKTEEDIPQEWSAEFVQQAALQFEENFARLLAGGDPNTQISPDTVQDKLKQMADAAQQVLTNPTEVTDQSVDFAASISQAIAGLNQGQENLRAPFNEDDLMKMFGGGGGAGQESGDLLPFMQGMMQGLLSKEVLGPSLQDFVQKLPAYLEKNKDTLSKEDAERYENQKKLMEEVLEELNKENDSDSTEVKKERFSKVLALMQKLQDYGQPPAELVGEVDTPFSFDPSGNPMAISNPDPSANPECSVM